MQTKEYKLEQLAIHEAMEWEHKKHEEDLLAEDDEYVKRRKLQHRLGDAMFDPMTALPRDCWKQSPTRRDGGGRWQFLVPLPKIGQAFKPAARAKTNPEHVPLAYGAGLFEQL